MGCRLGVELEWLGSHGIDATGEIGDSDPIAAVNEVLQNRPFDEVILSTLPPGVSRWLHKDLPHRLEHSIDIPVVHVSGRPTRAREG